MAIAFIGVALWKPWDAAPGRIAGPSPEPGGSGAATARTPTGDSSSAAAVVEPTRPIPTPMQPFPANGTILATTSMHRDWGLRTVVLPPTERRTTTNDGLVERWLGIDVAAGAAWTLAGESAIGGPADDVVAIGVTTPDIALALDVRFWRLDRSAFPERVIPIPIPGPEPASWLWLPDPAQATALGTWPAGTYQIDVLLGPRIVRLVATIPHAAPSLVRTTPPIFNPPLDQTLAALPEGPFAIVAGRPIPIAVETGPLVDEREAWLGPATGLTLHRVAQVSSPDVSGIGWFLAAGQQPASFALSMIHASAGGPETRVDAVADPLSNREALVIRPTSSGPFPAGLYQLTTSWTGGAPGSVSWQVEILPSTPATPPSSPLEHLARWVGLMGSPLNSAREPLVSLRDGYGDSCPQSTVITSHDELIGVVTPPGTTLEGVRIIPLDTLRAADVAIRVAPDAVPGLSVIAVPRGGLAVRDYDLVLTVTGAAGSTPIGQRICVR